MTDFYSHPLIQASYIEVYNDIIKKPIPVFENPKTKFGVMTIKLEKVEQTKNPILIQFTIDTSDSMNESDKIKHLIHTIKNIFEFILQQNAEIYVHVDLFNTEYQNIIPITRISAENISELTNILTNIVPNNGTDMELALIESRLFLSNYKKNHPTHKIAHFFLTDGESNEGNCSVPYLSNLVSTKYSNIFIGYGLDHNAQLLKQCASKKYGNYLFINQYENTGSAYGEILYSILYPGFKDVEITMKNAKIYNPTQNTWTDKYTEYFITSEADKKYHIQILEEVSHEEVSATIFGIVECQNKTEREKLDTVYILPDLINNDYTIDTNQTDIVKYMYRQRTQELLYESIRIFEIESNPQILLMNMKKKLKTFFKNIRDYMKRNDLLEDDFMKILCDDIYISYKTIGTKYGEMYSISRHTSQSNQQSYRVYSQETDLYDDIIPQYSHQIRRNITDFDNDTLDTHTQPYDDVETEYYFNICRKNSPVKNEEDIDTLIYEFNQSSLYSIQTMKDTIQKINNIVYDK